MLFSLLDRKTPARDADRESRVRASLLLEKKGLLLLPRNLFGGKSVVEFITRRRAFVNAARAAQRQNRRMYRYVA
jgi:hypothetical protein